MNRFDIVGRVGRDPELRTSKSGLSIVNLTIATDDGKKDGEKITTWHRVTFFGKKADAIAKYVTKGQRLRVEGRLDVSKRKIGDKEINQVDLLVNEFEFLGGGERQSEGNEKPARRPASAGPIDDSDIPF